MNSLAKRFSFKNLLKPGLITLIPVFFGCDTSEDPGILYELSSDASTRYVELELPVSSLYIDSLRTDLSNVAAISINVEEENLVYVGNHTDPLLGTVAAEGYFSLAYIDGLPVGNVFESDFELDSIYLSVEFSSQGAPNAAFSQDLIVSTLQDTLTRGAVYLSTTKQATEADIATLSGSIIPGDSVILSNGVDRNFGQSILDLGISLGTSTGLALPSLAIRSGANSEGISLANLADPNSRLYMDIYDSMVLVNGISKDTTYTLEFALSAELYSFIDRTNGTFTTTEKQTLIDLGTSEALIDPLFGIATLADLSPLVTFFNENDNIIINNAQISMEIAADDERGQLENSLAFAANENGKFNSSAIESNPFGSVLLRDISYQRPVGSNGQLNIQPSLGTSILDEENYTMLGTLFFQNLLNESIDDQLKLANIARSNSDGTPEVSNVSQLVFLSPLNVTPDRLKIRKDGIKLQIFFTEIDQ